jgi:hypothetical protein
MRTKPQSIVLAVPIARHVNPMRAMTQNQHYLCHALLGRFFYFASLHLPLLSITCGKPSFYSAVVAIPRSDKRTKVANRHSYNRYELAIRLHCVPATATVRLELRGFPRADGDDGTDSLARLSDQLQQAFGYALHSLRLNNTLAAYSSYPIVPFSINAAYAPMALLPVNGLGMPALLYRDAGIGPYSPGYWPNGLVPDAKVIYAMEHPLTGAMLFDDHVSGIAADTVPVPTTTYASYGLDAQLVHATRVDDIEGAHLARCHAARVPVRPKHYRDKLETMLVETIR